MDGVGLLNCVLLTLKDEDYITPPEFPHHDKLYVYVVVVGLRLSRETMGCAPILSQSVSLLETENFKSLPLRSSQ